MHTPQYTPNDVKIKPFNGQYSAPDMLLFATQFIMPTLPTGSYFSLLAFFIIRLADGDTPVSYPEIINSTNINSPTTVYRTVNRLEELGFIIVPSRNKRDTENIYRLNAAFTVEIPQKHANVWTAKGTPTNGVGTPTNGVEGTPIVGMSGRSEPTPTIEVGSSPDKTGDSRPTPIVGVLTTINTCNTRTCDHDHYSHEQAHDSHEQTHDSHEQTHDSHEQAHDSHERAHDSHERAHGSHERDHARMWKEALWHLEHQVMPAVFQGLFTGLCVLEVRGDCLVLQVHNEYQRAWLEKDHLPEILHIVQEFEEYQHITTIEVVCRTR
ncbi:hypothetical protein QUF58_01750 [Anaerolineales bacterium HSG24]|nr:hypothetical protein [Anaerolineales bacterium HSG24]